MYVLRIPIVGLIAAIYKEAGKQEMYLKQRPAELEKLVEIAKVQSTELLIFLFASRYFKTICILVFLIRTLIWTLIRTLPG